jgi:hypothetical protein
MTELAFASLGGARMAYIRPVRSENLSSLCADAPLLAPGQQVFVLFAADGTQILVAHSHEAAVANAAHERLEAVSLH